MEWCSAGWSVCLPLLIFFYTIKSRSSLLAPAHPGGPGKRAVKRLWCGGGADKWHMFPVCRMPSCHPTNSVKELKGTQSIDSNTKITLLICHWTPEVRRVASFITVARRQIMSYKLCYFAETTIPFHTETVIGFIL